MNWWIESQRERPGLALTLGFVLVAHAAVLSRVAGPLPPPASGQAGAHVVGPLRVRVITAAAPVVPPTNGVAQVPALDTAAIKTDDLRRAAAAPSAPETVPAAGAATIPPPTEPPYVPRGQLTRAPQLLTQMDVPFPDDVAGFVDLTVQISLFVDEEGAVQKVQVDTPQVPSPFIEAVQRTFARARFRPGQLHGENVRSLIRLEVEFHAPTARSQLGPLSAPAAAGNPAPPPLAPRPPS